MKNIGLLLLVLFICFSCARGDAIRASGSAVDGRLFLKSLVVIRTGESMSAGTGFVISESKDGYEIFTADHLISKSKQSGSADKNFLSVYIMESEDIIPGQGLKYQEVSDKIKVIKEFPQDDGLILFLDKKDIPAGLELQPLSINFARSQFQLGDPLRIYGYGLFGFPGTFNVYVADYSMMGGAYAAQLDKTNSSGLSGSPVFSEENGKLSVIGYVVGGQPLRKSDCDRLNCEKFDPIWGLGNYVLFKLFADAPDFQQFFISQTTSTPQVSTAPSVPTPVSGK